MPRLNVNVAVNSLYLTDSFVVLRRLENVGSNGRSGLTTVAFGNVPGVVYPDGDNVLRRETDNQRSLQTITVVTRFMLRGASLDGSGQNYQPDIVQWRGNSYVVENIEPYASYGAGFIEAACCMLDFAVLPPAAGITAQSVRGGVVTQYLPAVVSTTQATLPFGNVLPTGMLVFRNGVLQESPNDFTLTVQSATQSTLTFTVPGLAADTLVVYA